MFKRNEEGEQRMGAAPSAFLRLSDEGTIELDERPASARRAFAMLLMGLVLLAAPLFWVTSAQGADQPLAVKSGNSGSNSGPGSGDDDDPDNSGPGNADDDDDDSVDTPTGTTQGTGPSNSATNTAQNQAPGQGDDDDDSQDDTTNGQQSNGTRENSATNTAQTGNGPNTNTKD
jgi:hypothetical protein